MDARNVTVLVGSLRKASYSRRVADALAAVAPSHLRFVTGEVGTLPHYDQDADDEQRPPGAWQNFRHVVRATDAVLFVTPEYNRSLPGVLKNAIDVGSRPFGQSVWDGKPAAVVSVTPGATGGFGANHHLRQALVFLNMPALMQPEAYIGGTATLFAADGSLANDRTRDVFRSVMTHFASWIDLVHTR